MRYDEIKTEQTLKRDEYEKMIDAILIRLAV